MNIQVVRVQISMKLEMKDTPGQLVNALTPISDLGGNIIAVIHQREPSSNDTIDVQVVLELPDPKLSELIEILKRRGVRIQRIGKERLIHTRSLIMIGHIMHTDLTDTVDQIDRTGYAEVAELHMVMPAINEPSTARITIKSANAEDMDRAVEVLRMVGTRKEITIIEPVEELS